MLFAEAASQAAGWEAPWFWGILALPALLFAMIGVFRVVRVVDWYFRLVGLTKRTAVCSAAVAGVLTGTMLGVGAVAVTGLLSAWQQGPELPSELLAWGALAGLLIGLMGTVYGFVESDPSSANPMGGG
jgi:hypothetical protein